jgi:DNA-binding NarL/FixJ family response regulator
MNRATLGSVLLAERHHGLSEGVRGLLEAAFASVFIVADEASLLEGAQRLAPPLVVLDVAFAAGDLPDLVRRVISLSPASRILLLSVHDEPSVMESAVRAGAHGLVLKRAIATDLLRAVEAVMSGEVFFPPHS